MSAPAAIARRANAGPVISGFALPSIGQSSPPIARSLTHGASARNSSRSIIRLAMPASFSITTLRSMSGS